MEPTKYFYDLFDTSAPTSTLEGDGLTVRRLAVTQLGVTLTTPATGEAILILSHGKALVTGQYNLFAQATGATYYFSPTAPPECTVRANPCLTLENDFLQYWLGAYNYVSDGGTDPDSGNPYPVRGDDGTFRSKGHAVLRRRTGRSPAPLGDSWGTGQVAGLPPTALLATDQRIPRIPRPQGGHVPPRSRLPRAQ